MSDLVPEEQTELNPEMRKVTEMKFHLNKATCGGQVCDSPDDSLPPCPQILFIAFNLPFFFVYRYGVVWLDTSTQGGNRGMSLGGKCLVPTRLR